MLRPYDFLQRGVPVGGQDGKERLDARGVSAGALPRPVQQAGRRGLQPWLSVVAIGLAQDVLGKGGGPPPRPGPGGTADPAGSAPGRGAHTGGQDGLDRVVQYVEQGDQRLVHLGVAQLLRFRVNDVLEVVQQQHRSRWSGRSFVLALLAVARLARPEMPPAAHSSWSAVETCGFR